MCGFVLRRLLCGARPGGFHVSFHGSPRFRCVGGSRRLSIGGGGPASRRRNLRVDAGKGRRYPRYERQQAKAKAKAKGYASLPALARAGKVGLLGSPSPHEGGERCRVVLHLVVNDRVERRRQGRAHGASCRHAQRHHGVAVQGQLLAAERFAVGEHPGQCFFQPTGQQHAVRAAGAVRQRVCPLELAQRREQRGISPHARDGALDRLRGGFQDVVVMGDQGRHAVAERARQAQPLERAARHLHADGGMPVGVANAVLAHEERGRLADVVEERRPSHERILGRMVQSPGRMLQDVVYMVRGALVESLHGHQFGQHGRQHVDRAHERVVNESAAHEAVQLVRDALCGDAGEQVLVGQQGVVRLVLYRKTQLRGEAAGAQDAQRVLPETLLRVAHRAQGAGFEVGRPAERVQQPARRVIGQGVDGEVAPSEILFDVADERDLRRMPCIAIGAFDAIGGDLHRRASHHGRDGAMRRARFVRAAAGVLEGALRSLP